MSKYFSLKYISTNLLIPALAILTSAKTTSGDKAHKYPLPDFGDGVAQNVIGYIDDNKIPNFYILDEIRANSPVEVVYSKSQGIDKIKHFPNMLCFAIYKEAEETKDNPLTVCENLETEKHQIACTKDESGEQLCFGLRDEYSNDSVPKTSDFEQEEIILTKNNKKNTENFKNI